MKRSYLIRKPVIVEFHTKDGKPIRFKAVSLKRSPLKKKSKSKISTLTRKLDAVFSKIMRLIYAEKQKAPGGVRCYTCRQVFPLDKMHVSHYVSRSHNSLRWEQRNVRLCCIGCNVWKHGNLGEYATHLIEEKGMPELYWLKIERNKIKTVKVKDLEAMIAGYEKELEVREKLCT